MCGLTVLTSATRDCEILGLSLESSCSKAVVIRLPHQWQRISHALLLLWVTALHVWPIGKIGLDELVIKNLGEPRSLQQTLVGRAVPYSCR